MSDNMYGLHRVADVAFCGLHKKWGGLANNGGSKTIIRSSETLVDLGYSSIICASADKFRYFKHKRPLRKPTKCRFVVAIDVNEIPILDMFQGVKKFLWLRAWPLWQMNKDEIVKKIGKFKGTVICNSSWLVRKLAKHGIASKLCFAGYDQIWDDNDRPRQPSIMVGGLYHQRHKTKNYHFFKALKEVLGGMYGFKEVGRLNNNDEQLKKKYQSTDIWFAPTELEGFHNVPLEAALCGALVVCSDHPRNGMSDYCTNETAEIYRHKSLEDAAEKIFLADLNKVPVMQKYIRENIGTREENMKKFMKILEES